MGLIGWIKKEIESTSRQRRQSAPPTPLIRSLSSPSQERDEAYMKAVSKFHQWRSSQRFERLDETTNASAITHNDDDIDITDVSLTENERQKLMRMSRDRVKKTRTIGDPSGVAIYSNCTTDQKEVNRNKRLSLPTMQSNRKNSKNFQPTSTFDEIEEFEQNHCQELEDFSTVQTTSPPVKFFRTNSEPYAEKPMETPPIKKNTPKKFMGRGMLRRNKGKAPPPPTQKPSEVSVNFVNGNFQHYEITSASIYDEYVISSNGYKGNLRKEQPPEKINSVGESASSGSLSSDPDKNLKEIQKQRRLSPPYQTVINKHGDEVEYALPYNERESLSEIPPLPSMPAPQFEQIIEQNFKFLNSKLDFLNSQIDHENFDPIDASFSDVRRQQNLQVTDLDKSNDTGLAFPPQSGDIIRDLDALAKWSQNLKKLDEGGEISNSPLEQFKSIQNNIKVFNVNDIKYKSGILRNSFSTPLEFSNGYFHNTPITLRSTLPNLYSISNFADLACKREFEILAQIKHANIVGLMGISFDEDLRITSLVMEPFDFTLNHYLHQMDKFYSMQQTVNIIHQIANATRYLHENGFIHSNISSHAVLIRENPMAVKLSSFELTTEILPRESIGKIYYMNLKDSSCNETLSKEATDIGVVERYNKLSKQHFFNRTSLPVGNRETLEDENENECRLPYSIAYRRMFSMHYYQAPELLIPTYHTAAFHVMPSICSDVYALGLLLWESINRAVPYVIFNHDELIKGLEKGNIQLPMLDKSCIIFKEIFDATLSVDVSRRLVDVTKFITMLEDLHLLNFNKDKENKIEVLEIIEPNERKKTEKNIKKADQKSKIREKEIYFSSKIDPHKRFENAITSENLQTLKNDSKVSESVLSSEIEPHMSFTQQPGILQDDAIERIRKTVEDQKGITPKKPTRKSQEEFLEMSKNSTMFQSFFDFNKLHTPKVDKDVIYERTSTLKKRLKATDAEKSQKKSVKGLFDKPADKKAEKFEKMDNQLNQIEIGLNRADFMQEIVQTLKERKQSDLSSFLNQGMATNSIHEHSRSFDELPIAAPKPPNTSPIKRSESDLNYRFTVGDYSLPNTPIARQNKIRRNAWLSDGRDGGANRMPQEISRRTLNFNVNSNNSPVNRKKYNVNIKIHHNDLESSTQTSPRDKSTNLNNSSMVNIKLYNSGSKESPKIVTKVNNVDLNRSSYAEDINKKYYPNMPELLSDVFHRDKSLMQLNENDEEIQESQQNDQQIELRDKDDSDRVVIPIRSSVKDTIKFIEQTFNPIPPRTQKVSTSTDENVPIMKNNETQTDDDAAEHLNKVSESIQKLENAIPKNIVHKRVESLTTPKKVTTKVTLNVQKITTGRSSDVSHIKQVQEQARHSICNNAEIIKRLQMHFQGKDQEAICNSKNDLISSSCGSLVPKDGKGNGLCNGEIKKHQKYFCRNCGFTMIPAEICQRLQGNGRLSIASSESLQAIRYDENLQSLAALRKCNGVLETRSTEDLYIDDDFCQGISLAANMELLPSHDFFDSIDFNILSAEIFHTQEHEFDATLTENGNVEMKQIEYTEEKEDDFPPPPPLPLEEDENIGSDVSVPNCSDDKQIEDEIKQDEPKVEN